MGPSNVRTTEISGNYDLKHVNSAVFVRVFFKQEQFCKSTSVMYVLTVLCLVHIQENFILL